MKPSIGRIVVYEGTFKSNGTNCHPAIVNRVWSDKEPSDEKVLCNLTVFPDMAAPTSVGSIQIFDTRDAAKDVIASGQSVCYWPEQVQ